MLRSLRLAAGATAFVAALGATHAADPEQYVGAKACAECHQAEYDAWAKTRHATATNVLTAEQAASPVCSGCHTMVPGDERLAGVQCETCHGAGAYYAKRFVMRDPELARLVGLSEPKPAACLSCHTSDTPSVEPFDYARAWARIAHGKGN